MQQFQSQSERWRRTRLCPVQKRDLDLAHFHGRYNYSVSMGRERAQLLVQAENGVIGETIYATVDEKVQLKRNGGLKFSKIPIKMHEWLKFATVSDLISEGLLARIAEEKYPIDTDNPIRLIVDTDETGVSATIYGLLKLVSRI